MKSLYSRALEYAVRGYSIIPLRKDKRPYLNSWREFQSKPATDAQIEAWWEKWPDALIGIVTGEISGITVIDVDAYKKGTTSVDQFPKTFTVKTGNGGFHLYYKYQTGLTISANAYPDFPGIDIRSDGGYVVAAPSITEYNGKGGKYEVLHNLPLTSFPTKLFPQAKKRKGVSKLVGVNSGSRNDSIASFIGKLLRVSEEKDWENEVWPAVQRTNKTYSPPLAEKELRATFESICKKEKDRIDAMVVSPIQIDDGKEINIPIRRNSAGVAYRDMANALSVLEHHPYFKDNIRYNIFKQEIEYKKQPLEEKDVTKIQYFMQKSTPLASISKDAVYAAIEYYAFENSYDEAQDWLKSLEWDKTERLFSWVNKATGVDDDEYHRGIGTQWFSGMIKRIMEPGCTFDYVLVLVGDQGIGKTSLFRIIGGPWYKSFTGAIDNKDFYLSLRGAMLMDLDEGSALNKSDSIKLKSVITSTHDEYRAPYERVMKKYPRRFVFSMSTNDPEPFRDVTGNRRYWTIDGKQKIDFQWLSDNREQLFAEAYYYWKNKTELPQVPMDKALEMQEAHLPDDAWQQLVMDELQTRPGYIMGDEQFTVTILEVYKNIFHASELARLGRGQEMRIGNIFRKVAGLKKKRTRIDGGYRTVYVFSPERAIELQLKNLPKKDDFEL